MKKLLKRKKLVTKKFILVSVLLTVLLGIIMGVAFGNTPMDLEASDEWLDFIDQSTFTIESLEVESNGYKIETQLFIPEGGADKKPVVVFTGGSGHGIYQDYSGKFTMEVIIEYYHSHDFAVVLHNKRGMGESEGNWVFNDFYGRAEDLGAILDVVKTHNKIDPTNMGVTGHSQGGWIAPLVASQRDDVAFWVAYAGPATSYIEQLEDLHETFYACDGYTDEEIEGKIKTKVLVSKIGAKIGKVIPIGDMNFDADVIDYDPADMLRDLEVPGMFLFGENDPLVDPDRNAAALERIYGSELPNNISAYVVPSADHSFRVVEDFCTPFDVSLQQLFAPELFEQLDLWLESLGY